jgi:hypothetical protein
VVSLLAPPAVSAGRFHWDAPSRQFSAEISDLGLRAFGQVWDDSCDEGLTLISRFGDRSAVFVVEETQVSGGEVTGWLLKPARPADRLDFTLLIHND